jgi:hypothetical protein
MVTWLVEGPTVLYFVLGIAAVAAGLRWWVSRRRPAAIAFAAAAGLIAVLAGLDLFVPTDNKQIQWKIDAMAKALARHDVHAAFAHVSDRFLFQGFTKSEAQRFTSAHIGEVQSITVWNYELREISRDEGKAVVTFSFKGRGTSGHNVDFFNGRAEFVLDRDGQWRLSGFEPYAPQVDPMSGQPIYIPIGG